VPSFAEGIVTDPCAEAVRQGERASSLPGSVGAVAGLVSDEGEQKDSEGLGPGEVGGVNVGVWYRGVGAGIGGAKVDLHRRGATLPVRRRFARAWQTTRTAHTDRKGLERA
jgi:hypothetical protein